MKEFTFEVFIGTTSLQPEISRLQEDRGTNPRKTVTCLPETVCCSSGSLMVKPRGAFSLQISNCSSDGGKKQQFCTDQSDQEYLNKDKRIQMSFGMKSKANHDLWGVVNVAEMHERKLQKVRTVTQAITQTYLKEIGRAHV